MFFVYFLGELFIQSHLEDHRRDDFMIIRPNGELMICVDHPTSERLGFNGAKNFVCENGRVLIVVNLKNSLFSNDEISSKVLLPAILPLSMIHCLSCKEIFKSGNVLLLAALI